MQTALEEIEDEESDETLQPKQRTMRGVAPAKSLKKPPLTHPTNQLLDLRNQKVEN